MHIDSSSVKPIYLQIAEGIEDDIIAGRLPAGEPVYSQLVLSRELRVNPATAAKGIGLLVQKGILEPQRGQSMTVAQTAQGHLIGERRKGVFEQRVRDLLHEARKIGLTRSDVQKAIEKIAREEKIK